MKKFLISRTGGLLVIFLLAAAIPITVIQSQKQQEQRSRASSTGQDVSLIPVTCGGPNQDCMLSTSKTPPCSWKMYWVGAKINYGDVDGDGSVTSADAMLILRAVAHLYSLSYNQIQAAHVSGTYHSGSNISALNSNDAQLVLQYVANTRSTFPICNP